jgi:hypothetical protein
VNGAIQSVERMQAFDSLPQPLRRAIAQSDFIYEPAEFAARIAKGRRPETILRGLMRFERKGAQ